MKSKLFLAESFLTIQLTERIDLLQAIYFHRVKNLEKTGFTFVEMKLRWSPVLLSLLESPKFRLPFTMYPKSMLIMGFQTQLTIIPYLE